MVVTWSTGEVISDRLKARNKSSFHVKNSPDPGLPEKGVLEHVELGIGALGVGRRRVVVEMDVVEGEVNCWGVNTADGLKETAVVVVVVEAVVVVVETGSDSKVVDSKLVQIH